MTQGWLLPILLDRMMRDAIPIVVPVVALTLVGMLIGWRVHVSEYNRAAGGGSRFHYKIHLWQPFSYSPQPRYCNGCRQLISGFLLFRNMGYECQCCGLHSHLSCLLLCERSSCKAPGRFSHQLREGNLEGSAVCALCGVICSSSFSLFGLECLWCRKAFHATCLERAKESRQPVALHCDLGPLAHLVVPPSALALRARPSFAQRRLSVEPPPPAVPSPAPSTVPAPPRAADDEHRPASTANVDVDTMPTRRVALSARKANDWQLVNFPDTTDLRPIFELWEQAQSPPAEPPQAEEPSAPEPEATPPQARQPMRLLRSLVKAPKEPSTEAGVAEAWARHICALYGAVSDMLLLLERSGVFPFIVFVNPRSGGQLGSLILKESYSYLNPWQVVDMSIEKNPLEALTRFQGLAMTGRLRGLACGGDGTVSWLVDSVHTKYRHVPSYATLTRLYQCARAFLARSPAEPGALLKELKGVAWEAAQVPVAVLPLGTGNDLSKVLNWGANFSNHLEYLTFMRKLIFAKPVPIDMWTVEVRRLAKGAAQPAAEEDASALLWKKTFTNYVDLGIAARIALKFHTLREAHPELFRSRLGNKFLYGEVGVRDYLVDQSINFDDVVIVCDDEYVDLKPHMRTGGLEGLALVNIPSFGGGVEPWKGVRRRRRAADDSELGGDAVLGAGKIHRSSSLLFFTDDEQHELHAPPREKYRQFRPQRMADGRLELIGFRSLLHLGRVQVGMADSIKIAQGTSFTIFIKNKVPLQVDGEPSTVAHAEISIRWRCRTHVLALKDFANEAGHRQHIDDLDMLHELRTIHLSLDDIKETLEKASAAGEIDREQLCSLFRRFRYLSHPQLASA